MSVTEALGRRERVEIPAGTIDFRERGRGPAVVFAHGVGVNGDLWRHVAPALADTHRVIVPDLPLGAHATPLRDGADLSVFGLADIVADLIAALGLDDVTLVANDTGGAISQAVAARRAERLGALVLTSCDAFENYPPPALRYLLPAARVPGAMWVVAQSVRFKAIQRLPIAYGWTTHAPMPPEIMDSYTRTVRTSAGVRHDLTMLLRAVDPRQTQAAAEGLRDFDKPALVVWGADDRHFPRAHGERLAELLPRGRFELVAGSRCFIPEEQPAALVALLRAFLVSRRPARAGRW
jgi:pimeloyl-ACP methyl ester carboxylesterase